MGQYRTLFVIVEDTSEVTAAMRRAVALARRCGARLHLCMLLAPAAVDAIGMLSETVRDLTRATMLSSRRDWLGDYALGLREQGIEATSEVLWQEPDHENLILRALELQPDLVIKDAQRGLATHIPFLATTDQKLLCGCPYPLMIVQRDSPPLPRRIAAAIDPMHRRHTARDLNGRILRAAHGLSLQADAEVQVVSVVENPPTPSAAAATAAVTAESVEYRRNHQRRLRRLTSAHSVPRGIVKLLQGEPAVALARHAATARVDLLVIGTLYRGGIEDLLIGSNAKRLASAGPCDLLAIKPDGFDADFVAVNGFHALAESPPDPNLEVVLRRPARMPVTAP